MGRKKLVRNIRLKEILKEQGKDANWLADVIKRKFKINKNRTLAKIKGDERVGIMDRIQWALILKVELKEFTSH